MAVQLLLLLLLDIELLSRKERLPVSFISFMHLSFTLTGASAFLLLVLGITEIALTRHGEDLTSGFASRGTSDLSGDLAGEVDMNLLPEHYKKGSTWAVLAAGILTTVTGLMGLLNAAWRSCREAVCHSPT